MTSAQPTNTIEDYLQTIYSLQTEGETVISARLARWMRVTQATAGATVHRMERDGLVEIDDKKVIRLTRRGLALAENVARRHRLSERFLVDILGLGWAEAHEEAHRFEHGVSPRVEERLFDILNGPKTCPHGSPIPGTGAKLDPNLVRMNSLREGDTATVRFISEELEEDIDLMRYLERGNVKPGQEITVRELVPSTGVVVIETNAQSVSLGLAVAAKIRVLPSRQPAKAAAGA
ncbi:MAG: metal-dependent transcriptional regulator [Chloroflexi bacterium]|nr:metal-dependent transcriptional regulator [Chloroflexota bacterium]